ERAATPLPVPEIRFRAAPAALFLDRPLVLRTERAAKAAGAPRAVRDERDDGDAADDDESPSPCRHGCSFPGRAPSLTLCIATSRRPQTGQATIRREKVCRSSDASALLRLRGRLLRGGLRAGGRLLRGTLRRALGL